MEPIISVGAAMLGGFFLNMFNLWEDSKKDRSERVTKDGLYYLFFGFWPIAGGALAFIYYLDGSMLRPLSSLFIGLSAPATIQAMITKSIIPETASNGE